MSLFYDGSQWRLECSLGILKHGVGICDSKEYNGALDKIPRPLVG